MKWLLPALALLLLTGCGTPDLDDYRDQGPPLVLEDYFLGKTRAWGQFQDRFGEVRRRFEVLIDGRMDGDDLVLTEDFTYADGETETRVWRIRRQGPDTWEGVSDGVVGTAFGRQSGNAVNWRYDYDLAVGDSVWQVQFDDWLWRQTEDVVINRAYVSKFGIALGEVFITFVKER